MNLTFLRTLTALFILTSALPCTADLITRAESVELRRSNGKIVPRVVRDKDQQVIRLILTGMTLSSQELAELKGLERLKALVLFRTNITDRDLKHVEACKNLEHLNLTSTEVTGAAVDSILKLENLKSLCLGDVKIAPPALDRLRAQNLKRDRPLRWGYSQRKP